jgi:hypothetical protein
MEDGTAGRRAEDGRHKADEVAPVKAVLSWCERALPIEALDLVQDRL